MNKVLALVCFLFFAVSAIANDTVINDRVPNDFSVPYGLEGRVEFWKLIFTAYGKNHRVFHYRSYPEVIYSVLDFSDYEANLSGRELERRKRVAVDREINNIKTALVSLASGRRPITVLEKRIVRLFKNIPGGREKYRKAVAEDQIRYQTGIMERFRDSLVRSGRYLPIIEKIFAAEGLPPEVGRLPFVESSFDYEAYSSVGAAGIWQFMRTTGKLYMTVNNAIDERRDPVIASRAAAKYLKNSYQQLGEWPLAITSYNHGLGGVKKAVSATGTTHLPSIIRNYENKNFGFASSNFYAEFLAALEIEQNSEEYFIGLQRESVWRFDEVRLSRGISFQELVRYEGGDATRLRELNLAFRSPILSGRVRIPAGTLVKVPKGRANRIIAAVPGSEMHEIIDGLVQPTKMQVHERSESQSKRQKLVDKSTSGKSSNRLHVVSKGESLFSISRKYRVSLGKLTTFNRLGASTSIKPGQRLKIP